MPPLLPGELLPERQGIVPVGVDRSEDLAEQERFGEAPAPREASRRSAARRPRQPRLGGETLARAVQVAARDREAEGQGAQEPEDLRLDVVAAGKLGVEHPQHGW